MQHIISIIAILLVVSVSDVFGAGCLHRDYGHGATVCVCNAKHCDDFPPISKTSEGVVSSYVTSKSGDRFAKKELHFSKDPIKKHDQAITVDINHEQKFQTILGFGGAFTDAAGLNIEKLPKELQERLIKDYFAKDGIEYSIARVPIGGTDFSTRAYTYDDHPNDDSLSKFALQHEDLQYKIPYMKMAMKYAVHHINFYGSPWSAPAWMKVNNEIHHGGLLKGQPGGKYYKMFAKYIAKFIHAYNNKEVPIWGITIENEPGAGFIKDYKWNSMAFNSTLERDFIKKDLGPELHSSSLKDVKIIIGDDQLINLKQYADTIFPDHDAAKYVSGIAFHWYFNNQARREDLDDCHSKYPNYFILPSEACVTWKGNHNPFGQWDAFDSYAEDIIKDLNHYSAGWTDWNLALDLHAGPNWAGGSCNAPIFVNATGHEYIKETVFYAMGHFSKFLVPNSVRIHHVSDTKDHSNLEVTTFERPDHGTVLTILNKNGHDVNMHVHDPRYGYLDVKVKAHSLETLIWFRKN